MLGVWVCLMLLATAVSAQPKTPTQMYPDNAMHGKIMLVKEGADWKLEDAFWAT